VGRRGAVKENDMTDTKGPTMWHEHEAFRDHIHVMDKVLEVVRRTPPPATVQEPVILATEGPDGEVEVRLGPFERVKALFRSVGAVTYLEALDRGRASAMVSPAPLPIIVLAVNAAGVCAVTCIGDVPNAPGGSA
jgi:hypothetical protein